MHGVISLVILVLSEQGNVTISVPQTLNPEHCMLHACSPCNAVNTTSNDHLTPHAASTRGWCTNFYCNHCKPSSAFSPAGQARLVAWLPETVIYQHDGTPVVAVANAAAHCLVERTEGLRHGAI